MKKESNIRNFIINKSRFSDWESVFSNSSKIKIETLNTGIIASKTAGIINLKNENAKGIKNEIIKIPVLAHLVSHEKYGDYLIDTGFDSSFSKEIGGNFKGILKSVYFKERYIQEKPLQGVEVQLKEKHIDLKGVFLTHMHEHAAGTPSLPNEIPFIYGKGEVEINFFPLVYSKFFASKTNIQEIDFLNSEDMPILGKCIDIFGDGSFWAISTPGHTKGHIAYIVNGSEDKTLITGDVIATKRGFDLGIETGKYSMDIKEGKTSFLKLKEFANKYPFVKLIFGHETDELKIIYR